MVAPVRPWNRQKEWRQGFPTSNTIQEDELERCSGLSLALPAAAAFLGLRSMLPGLLASFAKITQHTDHPSIPARLCLLV